MILVGKLHPLLVHLPIGFLMIGLILHWWESFDTRKNFSNVLAPIFFLGALAAILSCLSGLQLMNEGEYETITLERHRNTGITLAVFSIFLWYLHLKNASKKIKHFFAVALTALLVITGHYGGTLTHGSSFLSFNVEHEEAVSIQNINDAIVYKDLIQPILSKKCVGCHGADKMKGKLRLDTEAYILKGGENGNPIVKDAILLKRILLPPDDEEHMPPKEKGQLTTQEISLIKWWIAEGADFKAKVTDLKKDSLITALLNQKISNKEIPIEVEKLPEVEKADEQVVRQLKFLGASISPVSSESNLLNINIVNLKDSSLKTWELFSKIAPQIFIFKADQPYLKDEHLKQFENAMHMRRLSLKYTSISNNAFQTIARFNALQSLNLSNTKVTVKGLSALSNNKKLRYLYILNIADSSHSLKLVNVEIIDKHYKVPILESDTSIVLSSN